MEAEASATNQCLSGHAARIEKIELPGIPAEAGVKERPKAFKASKDQVVVYYLHKEKK